MSETSSRSNLRIIYLVLAMHQARRKTTGLCTTTLEPISPTHFGLMMPMYMQSGIVFAPVRSRHLPLAEDGTRRSLEPSLDRQVRRLCGQHYFLRRIERIRPSLRTNVDQFPLAFISPLRPKYDCNCYPIFESTSPYNQGVCTDHSSLMTLFKIYCDPSRTWHAIDREVSELRERQVESS